MKRINERRLRGIVNESVRFVLSEIDWKTTDSAAMKADGMKDWTREVIREIDDIYEWLQSFGGDRVDIRSCIYKLQDFAKRKLDQADKLEDFNDSNFERQHGGVPMRQFDHDLENTPEDEWTPSQEDYARYKW